MKLSKFLVLPFLAIAAGCSSPTVPQPTPPSVNYTVGQQYKYYAVQLDANTDTVVAGSGDTITTQILSTTMTYQGMTNVTAIQRTHSNPIKGSPTVDTSYIAQSNGNYWHYNYGLESINENSFVINTVGRINAGWVLQAKLAAGPPDSWIAIDTTLSAGGVTATLKDSAAESVDTTVFQGAGSIVPSTLQNTTAKHSEHAIAVLPSLGSGSSDTYVSAEHGPVLDIIHHSKLENQNAPGLKTILIAAP